METNTPAVADEIKPYLNEIAEKLWSGHAAVMVGAGFSRNADRNPQSLKNFPDWNQLGDVFYKKIHGEFPGIKSRYLNPLKLAGEVDAAFGRPVLNKILLSNIPDDEYEPSQIHTDLLKLPWTDIFTTNYDTLLERARVNVESKKFDIVINKDDLIYSEKPRIVKLHGSFPSERPFIITEEDYRTYPKKFAPFVNTVQQSLLENTLCIIGFSGDDPNFLKWIGWIRDNLGEGNSPKMFLIGIFDLSDAQKKLLEKRHINLIDMSVCPNVEKKEHAKALDVFFKYLSSRKKDDNKLGWPYEQQFMSPESKGNNAQRFKEVIKEWKNKRLSYPNWVIPPEDCRRSLWLYTSGWTDIKTHCDKLETPHDIEFLYEQNWRLEKCLCPIYNDNIDAYQSIVEKYNPYPTIITIEHASVVINDNIHQNLNWQDVKTKWLELHISMMRYYREEGFLDEWEIINNRLGRLYSILSDELISNLHYERCLFALFTLKISEIREQLKLWPVNESLPFWEAKRAGLLAELGEINEAEKILETSLSGIRQHLNLSPISKDYSWVSKEAFVMLLLRCVKDAIFFNRKEDNSKYSDEDIKEEFIRNYEKKKEDYERQNNEESMGDGDIGAVIRKELGDCEVLWDELQNNRQIGEHKKQWQSLEDRIRNKEYKDTRQEFSKRWDYLKQFKCDPWSDFKLFDNCLEREPSCFVPTSEKYEFDIGRTTITNHLGSGDTEAIVAYSFLRYFEEAGIPIRIPGLQIGVKLAVGAVKRVGGHSPYWSLATFLRTGESKASDTIFGRDSIYKMSVKQIDSVIEEYLQVLKNSQTEIEKGSRYCRNLGVGLASVIPEALSRLCVKCSGNVKDKLLNFLKEIYTSDHRGKYEGMSDLIKRLLRSYSVTEQHSKLPVLLEFPVLKNLSHIMRDEYPEPFNFIDLNKENLAKSKDVQIEQKDIRQLLLKVDSEDSDERRRATRRISVLYEFDLINKDQSIVFGKALWSQIDESTGFPKNTDYYKFAFLKALPHPNKIDPASLFKSYVAKEKIPIQKTRVEKGIGITGGDIPFFHELIGATRRTAFINGIDWTENEAVDFFNRLLGWWDQDKEFIKKEGGSKFFDTAGEFKKRFANLTRMLNHVIIPRLLPQVSIKGELRRLLEELYEYNIPCVFACAASLRVFPEQKQEVFDKIKLSVLSKQEEKIRDGYNAIYEIFVLCNAKKIDEIPRDICAYITSPIKWRALPSLINAMRIAIDILKKMPEVFTEESLSDMLFGLDSLIEETSLLNQQSPFDTAKSLEVRYFAVSLAYALYDYYLNKDLSIPDVLQKWKSICNDVEEFSDIRNKWISR